MHPHPVIAAYEGLIAAAALLLAIVNHLRAGTRARPLTMRGIIVVRE
jgi:hypothetical protein